ncbi:hypothetical protein SAZ10_33090 [Mesorhizobium sp. BAC0120]|uniref:hypothetical protein n=1 Tax=Mesorhizobium sp. BAC0120 TaxID=3090670 RepID=UPI00298D3BCD|nr:hypothetical protein [Mesorhizobium sp. BAC0120]MDW6026608.1 hypothetical protein [Mesorhizobium sp. BAC0120]
MRLIGFGRCGALLLLELFAALIAASGASAAALENVSEIGPSLIQCWHPPAAPDGSAVTLRFGFRRDGSLMGAPRVTYISVKGGAALERTFADSAVRAIEQCSPLQLSPRFAATIGGKVYVMQFSILKRQPVIRLMYA